MKAVILAAGRGTRLNQITNNTPKPLVKINGKTLLEYKLEILPKDVGEVVIIVGYMKEKIINLLGKQYADKKITYVEQKELLGTGHALHMCKDYLKEKFIVLMGDDFYAKEDIEKCAQHENCILVKKVKEKTTAAKVVMDEKNNLEDIIEGVSEKNILVNTGLYVLQPYFFDYDLVPIKDGKEFGLPQTIIKMSDRHPVAIEEASFWVQINTPQELESAKKIIEK
jgi:NDP-sugar pyrophosphorylase family protein